MNKKLELERLGVMFKAVNASEMRIYMPSVNYEIIKDEENEKNIKSVVYEGNSINIGDKFTINTSNNGPKYDVKYKVNAINISKNNPKSISTSESIYNVATLLILPLLFDTKEEASYIKRNMGYLMNCYIDTDVVKSKDNYSVFVLLKFSRSILFKKSEENYEKHDFFVKKEDISSTHVLYELSIPYKYRRDFDLIIQGKYSKISQRCKDKILAFHGDSVEGSLFSRVLNRDKDLIKYYEEMLNVPIGDTELYNKIGEKEILLKSDL